MHKAYQQLYLEITLASCSLSLFLLRNVCKSSLQRLNTRVVSVEHRLEVSNWLGCPSSFESWFYLWSW